MVGCLKTRDNCGTDEEIYGTTVGTAADSKLNVTFFEFDIPIHQGNNAHSIFSNLSLENLITQIDVSRNTINQREIT